MIRNIKQVLLWCIVGLVIIAATAYGATRLYAPKPSISVAPTADELYQQELAVAQRTCDKVNKISDGLTFEGGPLVAIDCIDMNRSCVKRWGQHAIWNGTSRSTDNEQLIPNCSCDDGYDWLNTDGSIGVTLGTSVFNMIDGPGTCVVQQ